MGTHVCTEELSLNLGHPGGIIWAGVSEALPNLI